MNVHLVRSAEYHPEKFWQVYNLLDHFPGVMRFIHREALLVIRDEQICRVPVDPETWREQKEPPHHYPASYSSGFPKRIPKSEPVVSWETLFDACRNYRKEHDIGNDAFVVLLTEISNTQNWFAAADPGNSRNIFVHTAYWNFFTGSDQRYPVAYHVVTVVMKHLMFRSFSELNEHWHMKPRGCIMDFCQNKADISLKLRTGDICPSCLSLLEERRVDHAVVRQVFTVMEGIRAQMIFKDRFAFKRQTPELVVIGWNRRLMFPDLGNLEVHLTPLEKVVYLFFLNHPEGVRLKAVRDHQHEFEKLYRSLGNSDDTEGVLIRIQDLVSAHSGSLSEKISRIKRKLTSILGPDMAADFLIQGASGEPRFIPVARTGRFSIK